MKGREIMKRNGNKFAFAALLLSFSLFLSACSGIGAELKVSDTANKGQESVTANTYTPVNFPSQSGITEETDEKDIINYKEIARNSNAILYADMQNGHFALQDISTEKIWYSTPSNAAEDEITGSITYSEVRSELSVNYVLKVEESTSTSYKTEYSYDCDAEDVKTELIDNGFRVTYRFAASGITVPVEYKLLSDSFEAKIVLNSIDEGNDSYLISAILLPVFGAGDWNDEGYIFVPDGSGAIIDFSYHNDMQSVYYREVYGKEKAVKSEFSLPNEEIKIPVFGTTVGENTLMGIITQGDADASVYALYHSNAYGYTAVCGALNYRVIDKNTMFENYGGSISRTTYRVSKQSASTDSFAVEYSFLNGKSSGYVGMAEKYRAYLDENGMLNKTESTPVFNIQVYGAVDISTAFLGIDYNTTEILTTVSETKEIVDALKEKGISDIAIRYVGFSGDGVLNKKLNTSINPISGIGSVKDFKSLENDAELFPDYDLMQVRKSGNSVSFGKDVIRTLFNYKAEQPVYSRSIYNKLSEDMIYLLNGRAILGAAEKLSNKYSEYSNISFSALGSMLYSDFSPDSGMFKETTALYVEEALKIFSEKCDKVALENANAYTFKYADKIWDAPSYSSGYDVFKTDVPFYELVLHGSITMTSPCIIQSENPQVQILKTVEMGNELMFAATYADSNKLIGTRYEEIYSTGYKNWIDYAVEAYEKYQPLLERVYNQRITNHYEYSDGVFITEYESGVKTAVNYSGSSVEIDSVKIESMDYEILSMGGEENE